MRNEEFWQWYNAYVSPKLAERDAAFRVIFNFLDKFDNPIIIETGCVNDAELGFDKVPWQGHGCSTLLFDRYVLLNNGRLYSVDLDEDKVKYARGLTSPSVTEISVGDSVDYLKEFVKSKGCHPNLVYLDAGEWRFETNGAALHQFNELKAISPLLTSDTLVVVDDSPAISLTGNIDDCQIFGRAAIISQYAKMHNIRLAFAFYQSGWLGFKGKIDSMASYV